MEVSHVWWKRKTVELGMIGVLCFFFFFWQVEEEGIVKCRSTEEGDYSAITEESVGERI